MNHEEELINGFFLTNKRERYLQMVGNPRKRKTFLLELSHFKSLDPHYCFALPKPVHTPEQIEAFLRSRGAPGHCWVTSENSDLDGKEMPLLEALKEVVGYQMGTFLSCIPRKLAYFEDEENRWLLERRN